MSRSEKIDYRANLEGSFEWAIPLYTVNIKNVLTNRSTGDNVYISYVSSIALWCVRFSDCVL